MKPAATLLIDDEVKFSASIEASFGAHGMTLDLANDWDYGLRVFRAGLHELVIADYNIPGSKLGLKLLLEIKRLRPSSRLILISGAVTPNAEDLIGASGLVDRFLPKTGDLSRELRQEAEEATRRAALPSDWKAVAGSHVSRAALDEAALEAVDQALSVQISGR